MREIISVSKHALSQVHSALPSLCGNGLMAREENGEFCKSVRLSLPELLAYWWRLLTYATGMVAQWDLTVSYTRDLVPLRYLFLHMYVCACLLQVYGGDSVKSVLPSPYQTMVMPGQYQYMACILLMIVLIILIALLIYTIKWQKWNITKYWYTTLPVQSSAYVYQVIRHTLL